MPERRLYINAAFLCIAVIFAFKLMNLQVLDSNYSQAANSNIIARVVTYPLRGMILDRNGKEIVRNRPVFDLMIVPREFTIPDQDTLAFCKFFNIDLEYARTKLSEAVAYSRFKPSAFIRHLSLEDFAMLQDRLTDYPGIYPSERTVRDYPHQSLANTLGYVKEVDKQFLQQDSSKYYSQGDLIGKSGLEKHYEAHLRGTKGVSYVMRNVKGVVKGKFQEGKFDTIPGVGKNLVTTIDLDLQQYAERLMQNKRGAVVAIQPETGEILTIVSFPSYDPNMLTGEGKKSSQNYLTLVNDPNKPLFNRAIQAVYPPGSTFKLLMALAGLQDGALDTVSTIFPCDQSIVGCHRHPSPLDLFGSIQHSCNPYYIRSLRRIINQGKVKDLDQDTRIGLTHWKNHMGNFGMGRKLGIDLPFERPGLIPSPDYYDKYYYVKNWKVSNIYSIGIGQGEVLATPLQLANQAAAIANRGWFITPHLVKQIGDSTLVFSRNETGIRKEYFDFVARAMSNIYTASMHKMPDITVCAKTGTAQNPHGDDHSVFVAFAPLHKPQIAIAVFVENAGFGGRWAGPLAGLVIEKYIRGEISQPRKWIEDYVLAGDFITPKKPI